MILAVSGAEIVVIVVIVVVAIIVLTTFYRSIRLIQQGTVGVQKRLGQFHSVRNPGLAVLVPFIDTVQTVDVREIPRTGDQQDVITKDNVSVLVSATIFSQVVDPKSALFSVSNYEVAIFQLARTALRAVFGGLTLDEALTERERINTELQGHMESVTDKWGLRINRIEIVDIVPPQNILNAMALQKEADQQKRAAILQSEGLQQAAINTAQGEKQASILRAEGDKQSAILRAEGDKEAAIRMGEGRAGAIGATYSAIHSGNVTPELLAVLQLEALGRVASSDNAKLVVPYETAGIMGAAQALRSVLSAVPETSAGPASNGGRPGGMSSGRS